MLAISLKRKGGFCPILAEILTLIDVLGLGSSPKETLLEIPFPVVSRVSLAAHKIVQRAETVLVSTSMAAEHR